jgi:putative transposase
VLADHSLTASTPAPTAKQVRVSRSGNCYDNAPMECFFGTLKSELIHRRSYRTRTEARQDIVAYIEGFYNATLRHSALGYPGPMEFERLATVA